MSFPSSPTVGQIYTDSHGVSWTWNGTMWLPAGTAGSFLPISGGTLTGPLVLPGDAAQPLQATTLEQTQNASNLTSGVLNATLMNLGARLFASGTQLIGSGPTNNLNLATASPAAAVDGRINRAQTSANFVWNLPAASPLGLCLGIQIQDATHTTTITPAGSDSLFAPYGTYTNAAPLVIPVNPGATYATLFLVSRAGAWEFLSVPASISAALGWNIVPYFGGQYTAGTISMPNGTATKISLSSVSLDNMSWWVAANTRYVPKRAGRYLVNWQIIAGDAATSQCTQVYTQIWLNGGNQIQMGQSWNGVQYLAIQNYAACSIIVTCNGNTDYIEPAALVTGTTPQFFNGYMNITYLGP